MKIGFWGEFFQIFQYCQLLQIEISGFRKRDTKIKGKGKRNQSNKLQLDFICKQWGARDICQTGN